MSDPTDPAPKKKTVRKTAPKTEPKAEAPKAEKAGKKDDAALKAAILAAALKDAAFDGFTDKVLSKAGETAGASAADLARMFPGGPVSLIEYYSVSVDTEMEKQLAARDLASLKIRARIAAAIKTRLAILKPDKEAARRAGSLLALPTHAALGAKLIYQSVDAMWRAVGDTSTDFNFYTKRGILAGVYGAVLVRWFNDTSVDEAPTDEFLAARIENVMQFEKFKSKAKAALASFPAFANFGKKPAP